MRESGLTLSHEETIHVVPNHSMPLRAGAPP
jgi:hypothetical protein